MILMDYSALNFKNDSQVKTYIKEKGRSESLSVQLNSNYLNVGQLENCLLPGNNHQWMLKPLGEILMENKIFTYP